MMMTKMKLKMKRKSNKNFYFFRILKIIQTKNLEFKFQKKLLKSLVGLLMRRRMKTMKR